MHSIFCFSTDDASRVILSVPDVDGSDYINASFIDVRINFQTYLQLCKVEYKTMATLKFH